MSSRGDLVRQKLADRAANPHHAKRDDESDAEYAARVRMARPKMARVEGRVAQAPCGHDGETIFGSYVKCLAGCDAVKPASDAKLDGMLWVDINLDAEQKPMRHMSVGYYATIAPNGVVTVHGPGAAVPAPAAAAQSCMNGHLRDHSVYMAADGNTYNKCSSCAFVLMRSGPLVGTWVQP